MRGAPGRSDRHPSHTFTPDWCDAKYCASCGIFRGSLEVGIAEPCPLERRAEAVPEAEFDWLGSLKDAG
jgi:hypothetical protein